jgi:hypothetical protein
VILVVFRRPYMQLAEEHGHGGTPARQLRSASAHLLLGRKGISSL